VTAVPAVSARLGRLSLVPVCTGTSA
jgi:hypothetical protein